MKPSTKEIALPDCIIAQVNEVRDMSLPLRKQEEPDEDNEELQPTQMTQFKFAGAQIPNGIKKEEQYKGNKPKRRTLFLTLTDGECTFHALEDRPIPQIKQEHFKIGSKVLFKKGATVKRGRVILTPHYFSIIGHPAQNLSLKPGQEEEKKEEELEEREEQKQLQIEDIPAGLFDDQDTPPRRLNFLDGYQPREQWDYGRLESRETLESYFENALFLNQE